VHPAFRPSLFSSLPALFLPTFLAFLSYIMHVFF
jgi:hypothetical protein